MFNAFATTISGAAARTDVASTRPRSCGTCCCTASVRNWFSVGRLSQRERIAPVDRDGLAGHPGAARADEHRDHPGRRRPAHRAGAPGSSPSSPSSGRSLPRRCCPRSAAETGVRIVPSETLLTVMPWRATSWAMPAAEPGGTGLGRAVGRHLRLAHPRRVGDHGDDAAPLRRDHSGQHGVDAVHDAVQVDAEVLRPVRRRGVDEGRQPAPSPRRPRCRRCSPGCRPAPARRPPRARRRSR